VFFWITILHLSLCCCIQKLQEQQSMQMTPMLSMMETWSSGREGGARDLDVRGDLPLSNLSTMKVIIFIITTSYKYNQND